jgi:hypothetical protein
MQDRERVLGVHHDRPGGRAETIAFVAKQLGVRWTAGGLLRTPS